jgi:hypothetical protein
MIRDGFVAFIGSTCQRPQTLELRMNKVQCVRARVTQPNRLKNRLFLANVTMPWRAVDAEGEVLDVLVQTRRNKQAALKLMRKLLRKYAFVPDRLVADDLRSYRAAANDLGIARRHDRGRWRNNRAENSHQPT